jgi:hypothetical protein
MNVGRRAAFRDVGLDAGPVAKFVDTGVQGGHVLLSRGDEGGIIRIPEAGDVVEGCELVVEAIVFNPSNERLYREGEEQRGEWVTL